MPARCREGLPKNNCVLLGVHQLSSERPCKVHRSRTKPTPPSKPPPHDPIIEEFVHQGPTAVLMPVAEDTLWLPKNRIGFLVIGFFLPLGTALGLLAAVRSFVVDAQ